MNNYENKFYMSISKFVNYFGLVLFIILFISCAYSIYTKQETGMIIFLWVMTVLIFVILISSFKLTKRWKLLIEFNDAIELEKAKKKEERRKVKIPDDLKS